MVLYWNGPSHSYEFSYDGPFQNQTIINPKKKLFGIGMVFSIPSLDFEPLSQFLPVLEKYPQICGVFTCLREISASLAKVLKLFIGAACRISFFNAGLASNGNFKLKFTKPLKSIRNFSWTP